MTEQTSSASLGCPYCGGAAVADALTAEGAHATCPCGRTKLTMRSNAADTPKPPLRLVDRDPGDEQP